MRIRVATLNVWALPAPFAPDVATRLTAIGDRLPHLDLDAIALQEVWTADARRLLIEGGRRAGLDYAWHREPALGGSGLLVLARLPVDSVRFESFRLQGVPQSPKNVDRLGGKGFVRVRLRTPEGPVSLIDTHLDALYSNVSLRVGQVVQMAMDTWETREPIIAVGDFNFLEGGPEYRVLTGLTGLRDAAAALDRRQPTVHPRNPYRFDSLKPERRVDLVFSRDGVAAGLRPLQVERVFNDTFEIGGELASYSNHAGVLAEFEVMPQPSGPIGEVDAEAVALASRLLAEGRAEAEQLRRGGRTVAGFGLGAAGLAAVGVRTLCMSRRRLLRLALNAAALGALGPSLGYSMMTELTIPDHIKAFDQLRAGLSRVARARALDSLA